MSAVDNFESVSEKVKLVLLYTALPGSREPVSCIVVSPKLVASVLVNLSEV